MHLNLIQIIKEELDNWFDDEPSLADKYYQKNLGITKQPSQQQLQKLSGEYIGDLNKAWSINLDKPVAVYKNPENLNGFDNNTRGILLDNGDIYLAQNRTGLHFNIIELLGKKNIIPMNSVVHNYGRKMPENYITIVRNGNNGFIQSTAYDEFPPYYEAMFDYANEVQPFTFTQVSLEANHED